MVIHKHGAVVGFLAVVIALVLTATVFAAVNFKGNQTFSVSGSTFTVTGAVSGLGNTDLFVNLSIQVQATAVCTNPAGATQPPGQNPAPTTVTGSTVIPGSSIKNGSTPYTVSASGPAAGSIIAGAPGCPNPNWTETVTGVTFLSPAILTFSQGGVTVLGPASCTFSPSPAGSGASGTLGGACSRH